MKEKIILSNINERELLRFLALKDKGSFNVHVFDSIKLAKEALIRSGKIIKETPISSFKQECIIYNLLKNVPYFKGNTFEDAKNIANSLNYARMLTRGNEEKKMNEVFKDGEFKEKNNAILDVYHKYLEYLKENNYIDSVGIINYAIKNAKQIDAEFIVFEETPLDPLEEELLKTVSGQRIKPIKIRDFAGIKYKKLSDTTYTDAYGAINEVEHILAYIAKEKIAYEDALIVLIDPSYINQFLAYKETYDLPMSYGTGLDITYANAFKLLVLLDRWNDGFNGIDSLNALINAEEFDTDKFWANVSDTKLNHKEKAEIINTIGNLRINVNKDNKLSDYKNSLNSDEEKKAYPLIEKTCNELYQGYEYLIKTYTKINSPDFEYKAIKIIGDYLNDYFSNIPDGTLSDVINYLLDKRIFKELSKPNTIHITNLNGALATIRKHIFICGLNAKVFPGSPNENYLLLDSDLERFNEENVKNSKNKIMNNKKFLMDVLDNASSCDSRIHVSYSGYNLSELKKENPSSLVFEIYKKENGDDVTTDDLKDATGEQCRYFSENISRLKNIGEAYIKGNTIVDGETTQEIYTSSILNRSISPSAADVFFACPRHFYLAKILGIEEPSDNDPFVLIPDNDEGTLIHECMEDYGDNPSWSKETFMENAEYKFNKYFKKRNPVHTKNMEKIKNDFLKMAETGYKNNPGNKVVASEANLGPYIDPITGLTFGGIVDRIEELENGKYQIIDYKTYKSVKNHDNDVDTCFQVLLYAYIYENQNNKEVESCEYRYLRNVRTIKCDFDEPIKNRLKEKLQEIKNALDTGDFPLTGDQRNCRYCKLEKICGKGKEEKMEGE